MGHLLNEPIQAEHDRTGRLTAYEWRGSRYAVDEVLKTYGTSPEALVYRVRINGDDGMAIAELSREADRWRIRHLFCA